MRKGLLKEFVKGRKVKFVNYHRGFLLYEIEGVNFPFQIPISDTGEVIFTAEDYALFFTRWIRPAMEQCPEGQLEDLLARAKRRERNERYRSNV